MTTKSDPLVGYRKADSNDQEHQEPRPVRVNVPVSIEQRARWRRIANRQGLNLAEAVRFAMEHYQWR